MAKGKKGKKGQEVKEGEAEQKDKLLEVDKEWYQIQIRSLEVRRERTIREEIPKSPEYPLPLLRVDQRLSNSLTGLTHLQNDPHGRQPTTNCCENNPP